MEVYIDNQWRVVRWLFEWAIRLEVLGVRVFSIGFDWGERIFWVNLLGFTLVIRRKEDK